MSLGFFRVLGLGFKALGFRALGFRVLGLRAWSLGCCFLRLWASGCKALSICPSNGLGCSFPTSIWDLTDFLNEMSYVEGCASVHHTFWGLAYRA